VRQWIGILILGLFILPVNVQAVVESRDQQFRFPGPQRADRMRSESEGLSEMSSVQPCGCCAPGRLRSDQHGQRIRALTMIPPMAAHGQEETRPASKNDKDGYSRRRIPMRVRGLESGSIRC